MSLEGVKKKIDGVQKLHSIVRTMKILSAVSIRQFEKAVESLREYAQTIEMGIHIAVRAAPEEIDFSVRANRIGIIVFGSDRGMCGQFNDRIAEYMTQALKSAYTLPARGIVVGERLLNILRPEIVTIDRRLSLPGSVAGITEIVYEALLAVQDWRAKDQIDQLVVFYNRPLSGVAYHPIETKLLPLDQAWISKLQSQRWPSRPLPTFRLPWQRLFGGLIEQFLFISMYRACAESLASENVSRFVSMERAERNIEDRLDQLHVSFHQERHRLITEELLDVIAGAESVSD